MACHPHSATIHCNWWRCGVLKIHTSIRPPDLFPSQFFCPLLVVVKKLHPTEEKLIPMIEKKMALSLIVAHANLMVNYNQFNRRVVTVAAAVVHRNCPWLDLVWVWWNFKLPPSCNWEGCIAEQIRPSSYCWVWNYTIIEWLHRTDSQSALEWRYLPMNKLDQCEGFGVELFTETIARLSASL